MEPLDKRTLLSAYVVNTTSDITNAGDGLMTLREAIVSANTNAGADTISFDSTVFAAGSMHTITLAGGQMQLTDTSGQTTITGPGQDVVTVDAHKASRILQMTSGVTASISGMKLVNGLSPTASNGGAILNAGTLSLSGSTISGSAPGIASHGGAIANLASVTSSAASLTLTNCTISNNTNTTSGANGGAIYNASTGGSATATLTLTGCTFSGNSTRGNGGAVYNDAGGSSTSSASATISNCTFSSNSAGFQSIADGGAIHNTTSGGTATLNVSSCTFDLNKAGTSGIGKGGAISNLSNSATALATINLTSCTLTANTASNDGGAIMNSSSNATARMTLRNCTLSGNSASIRGGGINSSTSSATNTLTLINCTVAANSAITAGGGGIYALNGAKLVNTIVSANTTTDSTSRDIRGAYDSVNSTNNLIGALDATATGISNGVHGNLAGSNGSPLNPLLGTLGNYGGDVRTLPLLPGSPAIDAAAVDLSVTTDARGVSRSTGAAPDIGAYESRAFTLSILSGNNQSVLVSRPFTNPLVVQASGTGGDPVTGGVVTFTAPASGASASLSPVSVTVGATGEASTTATANIVDGTYSVSASMPGTSPISFTLTNTPPSEANPLVVTTVADEWTTNGQVSLREATIYANYHAGPDTITFDPIVFDANTTHTLQLAGGQFELSDSTGPTTITGPGENVLTIDANHLGRVLQVNEGVSVNLSEMRMINGTAPLQGGSRRGGAIKSSGSMTLTHVTLNDNISSGGSGGAIYIAATALTDVAITLANCTFSGNSANNSAVISMSASGSGRSSTLSLSECIVQNNLAGGGISYGISGGASGTLTVTDCSIVDNGALTGTSGSAFSTFVGDAGSNLTASFTNCDISNNLNRTGRGGAIAVTVADGATNTLHLVACTLNRNSAAGSGGAMEISYTSASGAVTLEDCTLAENSCDSTGGALIFTASSSNVPLSLTNCTITDNSAAGAGGLHLLASGADTDENITITNCTISNNIARNLSFGGGMAYGNVDATLTIAMINCTLSGNSAVSGGAIYGYNITEESQSTGSTTLNVFGCTFSGNSTTEGPGGALRVEAFVSQSTLTLNFVNSTFTGNSAGDTGGAMYVRAGGGTSVHLNVANCTISANSAGDAGGGIYAKDDQFQSVLLVAVHNSIVAQNSAATNPDISGPYTSTASFVGGNPMLAPLANNGGPTQTMALLPGSPCINTGSNDDVPAGVTLDQRGAGFARIVGNTVDIGAYELATNGIWTGQGDGVNWSDPANWSSNILPAAGDDVFIQTPGEFTVNLASTIEVHSITLGRFSGSSPTLSLTSNGNRLLRVVSLIVNGASKLDLHDNDMIVTGMSLSAVESLVKSGFGNSNWLGTGIASSTAAGTASRMLGVVDNAATGYTTFSGQTVSSTDVLVKFTYLADANLDGLVNPDDFTAFVTGFSGGPPKAHWGFGDFNYDGFVNPDDFTLFVNGLGAFNASGQML